MSGTGGDEREDGWDGKEKQASMETAKRLDPSRRKYEENYVYAEPIKDVARDEHLKLQMGFDIMDSEFTEYTQIVNVFKDAELTQPIGSHFEWDEETKELEVTPPRWSVGGIMSEGLSEEDPGYQPADTSLFDKGELNDWETSRSITWCSMWIWRPENNWKSRSSPCLPLILKWTGRQRSRFRSTRTEYRCSAGKEVDGAERYYVMSMNVFGRERSFRRRMGRRKYGKDRVETGVDGQIYHL